MNKEKKILKFYKGDWKCISGETIITVFINDESVEVIRKKMDGSEISHDIFNSNNRVGGDNVLLLNNLKYIIKDANETTLEFGELKQPYISATDNSFNHVWEETFKRMNKIDYQ